MKPAPTPGGMLLHVCGGVPYMCNGGYSCVYVCNSSLCISKGSKSKVTSARVRKGEGKVSVSRDSDMHTILCPGSVSKLLPTSILFLIARKKNS